ncbi:unnamed protein product [Rotaria socialis]|uniref:C2H2-type domain-containing protein n=1 Tax=Rotaria socialis TaxID=392032 RepID=A0A818GQG9_9BILA|nr:unnamed protein product [Rotaria socialis]CAF3344605.1 unnamed protein product [Rotaria socialis]CAF3492357.1 unnamed protein product [Rotaria socialis]CAF4372071.1 unnamed protein product [Rotaria socialis]CAF4812350.1 unnamed protein product [Rotaria socialis]
MPARKPTARYSLYRSFVDAYMKAHAEKPRKISHAEAQAEWNSAKTDEKKVQQKLDEYLEKIKANGTSTMDVEEENVNDNSEEKEPVKKTRGRKKKTESTIEFENGGRVTKRRRKRDESSDPDFDPASPAPKGSEKIRTAAEILAKNTKAPAQEKVSKELHEINERIIQLVQVKNMGMATAEQEKQLKKLLVEQKKKSNDLKRLKAEQAAKKRYREIKKRKIEALCEKNPELALELNKIYRPIIGRPPIEEECPDLLQIIEEIAKVGGAADDNRRSQTIRPCLTLDDLREKIKERGYDIKRSTLYYRLLPHRSNSIDGKKHVRTVPVRLRKAQNDEHSKHEDGHFATATIRYIKDLAGIFGNEVVFFLSQDDKCKVPIGLPAAKIQAPMLMHLDYRVRLPDHDWTVAPRHQLTPSVYAACMMSDNNDVGYSGPTYIAIRSAKHDRSDANSHTCDFDRLVGLKEFEKSARDYTGQVKPIVIITVDGGPDENPRFPKTLVAAIRKFRKYNLDALFVLTHAPGQSAYNVVERRMAPLSHDLAGLILPHDHFGTHLNDSGVTVNPELERINFKKAGEVLAEVWCGSVIDEYPVVAEYIDPPASTQEELRSIDVNLIVNNLLDRVCEEEEAEEAIERRIRQTDEYYQDRVRAPRFTADGDLLRDPPKYDIDEYWSATHVLQTQYTIQIIRCNSISCCGPWRSNYIQIFPHRFLPAPIPFERTPRGIAMAERDYQKGVFYGSLIQRIQFHGVVMQHTQNDILPFDYCCASARKELKKRVCPICKQYIPSAYRMKNHYKIHQQQYASNCLEYDEDLFSSENALANDEEDAEILSCQRPLPGVSDPSSNGVVIFSDMLDWLKSDFEELDLKEQIVKREDKKHMR